VPLSDVLAQGYANDYAGYVTTPEEYTRQRYEGGHTMFGRWQLPACQQEFARVAADMREGRPSEAGPTPRLSRRRAARGPDPDVPVVAGAEFGAVLRQPRGGYRRGEQVRVRFVGANPNNALYRGGSYLQVQRRDDKQWHPVADDNDWCTSFEWEQQKPGSIVTIGWDIDEHVRPGRYRITYCGDARDGAGRITSFTGTSREFPVA